VKLTRLIKSVVAVLATTVLVMPLSARELCMTPTMRSEHNGHHSLVSYQHRGPILQMVRASDDDSSCCQFSAAPQLATNTVSAQKGPQRLHSKQSEDVLMETRPPELKRVLRAEAARPPSSPLGQALLRVFLI
jgi:hypothetical protein